MDLTGNPSCEDEKEKEIRKARAHLKSMYTTTTK